MYVATNMHHEGMGATCLLAALSPVLTAYSTLTPSARACCACCAGIHPLVSVIPKPVRHGRLVAALLKSAVFMGAKIKAEHLPLLAPELDAAAHLLSLLPERWAVPAVLCYACCAPLAIIKGWCRRSVCSLVCSPAPPSLPESSPGAERRAVAVIAAVLPGPGSFCSSRTVSPLRCAAPECCAPPRH